MRIEYHCTVSVTLVVCWNPDVPLATTCTVDVFNSKLRDEFLNGEIFYSMKEVRVLAERWRVHYNTVRPHSSLGYRPPAPQTWVAKNLGYGEVETATRFPLLHTPDCDEISTKLAALH